MKTLTLLPPLSRWRENLGYQGGILATICAVVTLSVLLSDGQTHESIQLRTAEDRLVNLAQVLPQARYDNNPLEGRVVIQDADFSGKPIDVYPAYRQGVFSGAAFEVTTIGYGGPLTLMLGLDEKGQVLGVRVLAHKETPGLTDGIQIDNGNWIRSFEGHSLDNTSALAWHVKKDGGEFDQFSGATITPRAIVKGVYEGTQFFSRHVAELSAAAAKGENQ